MPKHVFRLLLLIAAVALLGLAAKRYFTAPSFFEYGHYRGDSVAEIASDRPKYKTPESCRDCHAAAYADWAGGIHNSASLGKVVKCEVCHGAAGSRDIKGPYDHVATGADHPNGLKLALPTDPVRLCTQCHEKMPGRPAEQRQIVVAEHGGAQNCTTCHNAHSPKIGGAAPAVARAGNAEAGQKLAGKCVDCHGPLGVSNGDLPGPNLAGQSAAYIAAALVAYKSGARDNPLMAETAGGLSESDIADLAAYFSGLACGSAHGGAEPAAASGRTLAGRCALCHGEAGIGRQPLWPNLAGQSSDYLAAALQSYKEGGRKHPLMSAIVKSLSDADATNLAAYFSNASCK